MRAIATNTTNTINTTNITNTSNTTNTTNEERIHSRGSMGRGPDCPWHRHAWQQIAQEATTVSGSSPATTDVNVLELICDHLIQFQ